MHPILQLDRAGWTIRLHRSGELRLVHAGGTRLTLRMDPHNWSVIDTTTRHKQPVLTSIGLADISGPRKAWLWQHLERVTGAHAQDRFQNMLDRIRTLAVCAGHTGYLRLERAGGHISWFSTPQGMPHSATGRAVFGTYLALADAAVNSVADVSVPGRYTDGTPSSYWTNRAACVWDIQYTLHERLALLHQEKDVPAA